MGLVECSYGNDRHVYWTCLDFENLKRHVRQGVILPRFLVGRLTWLLVPLPCKQRNLILSNEKIGGSVRRPGEL